MNIKSIKRDKDIIFESKDLDLLYSIKKFPIFMGCTESEIESDIFLDLDFYISKSSGLVQLGNLVPLDLLYSSCHFSGATGKIWENHHQELAEIMFKYKVKNIYEIGGQHDTLFKEYKKINQNFKWSIIDPGVLDNLNSEINIIKDFFDENTKLDKNIDCVIHSHLFEHLYNPIQFIKNITNKLDEKLMIFSVPNLKKWLDNKYSNVLHFEHTFLLSENYMDYILNNYDLEIIEKKYFLEDHSIFYVVRKNKTIDKVFLHENYEENKKNFLEYLNFRQKVVNYLNKEVKSNKKIYIFGAHINTQSLIWMGLNKNNIVGVLDNNKNKHGKRLYGTEFMVFDPQILKDKINVTVIIDVGKYSDEIRVTLEKINNHLNIITTSSLD